MGFVRGNALKLLGLLRYILRCIQYRSLQFQNRFIVAKQVLYL